MKCIAALTLALWSTGCARSIELFPADPGEPDAGPAAEAWGRHVASLGLPDCPAAAPVMVVNTLTTGLSGGKRIDDPALAGPLLSFPQAMWIAANRAGPDTIRFDPEVFPVDAPATILLSAADELPPDVGQICIDGRDRGVVFDWTQDGVVCQTGCFWWLTKRSLQVGVTLLHLPNPLAVADSQVAGCRLGTDGTQGYYSLRTSTVEAYDAAVVGPANVFSDPVAVRVLAAAHGVQIRGNDFGVDSVTHASLGLIVGVELSGEAAIDGNLFGAGTAEPVRALTAGAAAVLTGNLLGVDREGAPLPGARGLTLAAGTFSVGPGNVIRGTPLAVKIGDAARVRVTRNSVTGNGAGIGFEGAAPVVAPAINSASATQVTGTCPSTGTIEVFSDKGGQGELFVGTASCIAGGAFQLLADVPAGRNVTATLTDTNNRTSGFSSPFAVP